MIFDGWVIDSLFSKVRTPTGRRGATIQCPGRKDKTSFQFASCRLRGQTCKYCEGTKTKRNTELIDICRQCNYKRRRSRRRLCAIRKLCWLPARSPGTRSATCSKTPSGMKSKVRLPAGSDIFIFSERREKDTRSIWRASAI